MAKKEAPTIKTERLTLRRLREEDIPNMAKMFGCDNVTKHLNGETPPSYEHSMLKLVRARRDIEWAIVLDETIEFIGTALIPTITEGYLGEIGCVLLEEYWGQGYAKETMLALVNYCKKELRLKRLCARIDNKNMNSKRLFESLNFKLDAVLPSANFGGRVCDIAYYSKSI